MPTPKIKKILYDFKSLCDALNRLENEPAYKNGDFSHEELVDADREALRNFVIATMSRISSVFIEQHREEIEKKDYAFLTSAKKDISRNIKDTMYTSAAEIADVLLSNNTNKFSNEFADKIIRENLFFDVVKVFSDEILNDPNELDPEIDSPNDKVSAELKNAAGKNHNPYDIIPDLLGSGDIEMLRSELEDAEEALAANDDPWYWSQRQTDIRAALDKSDATKQTAEITGKEIARLLDDIDPENEASVYNRLVEITAIIANDRSSRLSTGGYNVTGNYERSARLLTELMKKNAGIPDKWMPAGGTVDFTKLAADAKAKFAGKLKQEKINEVCDKYAERMRNIETDARVISDLIKAGLPEEEIRETDTNAITDAENRTAKNYEKLLNKVLDGTVRLDGLAGENIMRSPEGVAKVAKYIDRLLEEEQYKDLRLDALKGERLKSICDGAVNSALAIDEYAKRFNGQLGKRNLTDKDRETLINGWGVGALNSAAAVKYVGITEFVEHDSELLNDAISTCARLAQYHQNHPWYYRIIHPVNYYNESEQISKMKSVFTDDLKMPKADLANRLKDAAKSSADPINRYSVRKEGYREYRQLIDSYQERSEERNRLVDDKIELVKRFGNAKIEKLPEKIVISKELPKYDLAKMSAEEFEAHLERQKNEIAQIYGQQYPISDEDVKTYKNTHNTELSDKAIKELLLKEACRENLEEFEKLARRERENPTVFFEEQEKHVNELKEEIAGLKEELEGKKSEEKPEIVTGRRSAVETQTLQLDNDEPQKTNH